VQLYQKQPVYLSETKYMIFIHALYGTGKKSESTSVIEKEKGATNVQLRARRGSNKQEPWLPASGSVVLIYWHLAWASMDGSRLVFHGNDHWNSDWRSDAKYASQGHGAA
jgi:hypothetical protein